MKYSSEYKYEIGIAVFLFFIPIILNFIIENATIEWKILSFIIGAFSIIPIMFILYEKKYKSYYMHSILHYKGSNEYIFEFLKLWLESHNINNDSIKCSICLQDKFVIDLLQRNKIIKWNSVDSMGAEFLKKNKDNLFLNTLLKASIGEKNINRLEDESKQYDFAIATLQDKTKIVFSEHIGAETRSAQIFFNEIDIQHFETRLLTFK